MDRRSILAGAGAWAAFGRLVLPGGEPANAAEAAMDARVPVFADHVRGLAQELASREFARPKVDLPAPFDKLTYDQYRDIRFRAEGSIWRAEKLDWELQLFPIGFLYDIPVDIWLVEEGKARRLEADGELFHMGPLLAGEAPAGAPFAFSGFRIHGPLNRSDYYDEFVVFQGASYFRAVGRNQAYGMSARGLAIDTAQPTGEEFPLFRAFWIEKPKAGAPRLVLHALLDSPSAAGAYRFVIEPGEATVMDVDVSVYPRRTLAHAGIAPLTSMFLHGSAHGRIGGDFRPSVHDSEGLAIINGNGERLWRPLTNPRTLQVSAFVDQDPKGFGLTQRDRAFHRFEDLEAHYERRPSVWIEPKGTWGVGSVELIEIPAEEEIHDNIVAYWKPSQPLEPGKAQNFSYRLHWGDGVPVAWTGARVRKTFVGDVRPDTKLFVVDYEGPGVRDLAAMPQADVSASAGGIHNLVVQPNPEIEGVRVSFELATAGTELIELRLRLKVNDRAISENWLYRWTRT